jgi:hypothetical protein
MYFYKTSRREVVKSVVYALFMFVASEDRRFLIILNLTLKALY